jgi:hypothetical protein
MARALNTTLGEAIRKVRFEAGQSANVGHGANDRDAIVHLINRVQTQLATNYDWPRRNESRDITLTPGVSEYDIPDPFTFEGIERVVATRYDTPHELTFGIRAEHYSHLSATDPADRRSPVRNWDFLTPQDNTSSDRLVVWPTPDTEHTITLEGSGQLLPLVKDNDLLAFNGDMVALFVASEMLADQDAPMAQTKQAMAVELRRSLHHRQGVRKQSAFYLGRHGVDSAPALRRGIDYMDD